MAKNQLAIAGIHTNIGKTIAAAVIAEALGADYWKPVQAGIAETDSALMRQFLTDGERRVHNEAVVLTEPMSPHAAAEIDNVEVDFRKFTWPVTDKPLLIETAGGLLSPMSADTTMADFISYYKLPTLLISMNYLGSINHTLLTIEVLKSRGIDVKGIIINGLENESSESFIRQYTDVPLLARVPFISDLTNTGIKRAAFQLKPLLMPLIG